MEKYNVFLSYSNTQQDAARRIKAAFDENGITYIDRFTAEAGTDAAALVGCCNALVMVISDDIRDEDNSMVSLLEAAVKQSKVIINYSVEETRLNESLDFLTQNSISINAGDNDDSLNRLVKTVQSVNKQTRKPLKKKVWIPVLIVAAVVVIACAALLFTLVLNPKPTETGVDGECTWSYYEGSKTLKISGNGRADDYFDGIQENILWQQYADYIETVIVEDGVTSLGIGKFYNLVNLSKVVLPNTLEELSNSLFTSCYSLTELEIPESVTLINEGAIADCPITELHIPANTSLITGSVCTMCTELTTITVDPENAYYCAEDNVLFDIDKTTLIEYPSAKESATYTVPSTVHTISDSAFAYAVNLEEVIFSEPLTEISDFCFTGSSIRKVTLPDTLESIREFAFSYCEALEEIGLPDGLKEIDEYAFFQCPALKEIVIPDSVTEIGDLALSYGEQDGEYGKYHLQIKGSKDSVAKAYADDNGLEYCVTD